MKPSSFRARILAYAVISATVLVWNGTAGGQPSQLTGTIAGAVTAHGPNAEIIKAAHVLVQLWRADATTGAARDSACNAWLADKVVWLQATEELESPSGMSLVGTRLGKDVQILHALYALRRDTVRTGDDGIYKFADVPPGAYTVVADTYAGDRFLQWNADVGALPKFTTHADLGASLLAENQYCTLANDDSTVAKVYEAKDVDPGFKLIAPPDASDNDFPVVRQGSLEFDFVVNENGIPDPETVTIKALTLPVSAADARHFVAKLRFTSPTVKGRPVKVRTGFVIRAIIQSSSH